MSPTGGLHPQLAPLDRELSDATTRARAIVEPLDDAHFRRRPSETAWSVAECIVHLSLTTENYLPLLDAALAEVASAGRDTSRRYRRNVAGGLLAWSMEPPVRFRAKTIPAFVPDATAPRSDVLATFERLQGELSQRVASASGLDLNSTRIVSPFNARLSYNVYTCLMVLTSHERRHLWQAEQAVRAVANAG